MDDTAKGTLHKSIRFPVELWAQLEVEAGKACASTSEFVRASLEEVLNKRNTQGVVPFAHWHRWSAMAEAAGHSSVVSWVDALIQKTLNGPAENRPNFDQLSLPSLSAKIDALFKKEEGQLRHMELSATLETFVLLRLWLEKTQPDLVLKAHALAEEHYRQGNEQDKPLQKNYAPQPSPAVQEMALS